MTTPTLPPGATDPIRMCARGRALGADLDPDPAVVIQARFTYRPADPYAITIDIRNGENQEPQPWVVSRETLLLAVLWGRAEGAGDFRAAPVVLDAWRGQRDVPCIRLTFINDKEAQEGLCDGILYIDVAAELLTPFCQDILRAVPPGSEHTYVNMDAVTDRLLDRGTYWEA